LISAAIARARDQFSTPSASAAHVSGSRWNSVHATVVSRVASLREQFMISASSSGKNSETPSGRELGPDHEGDAAPGSPARRSRSSLHLVASCTIISTR
jgi:hypothetical protein